MKRLIVITTPYFFRGESVVLTHLFEEGMQRLHLRKPDGDADELRRLLDKVPAIHYPKIVLHDCFGLAADYGLGGVHLNIALGGIDLTTLPLLRPFRFGGAAVLGALWGDRPSADRLDSIIKQYKKLQVWN